MAQYKRKSDGQTVDARPVNVKTNGYESIELTGGACDVPKAHMIVTDKDGIVTAPSDAAFNEQYEVVSSAQAKPAAQIPSKAEVNN